MAPLPLLLFSQCFLTLHGTYLFTRDLIVLVIIILIFSLVVLMSTHEFTFVFWYICSVFFLAFLFLIIYALKVSYWRSDFGIYDSSTEGVCCMCVYMRARVCMCVHVYMHMYGCLCMCLCVQVSMYLHMDLEIVYFSCFDYYINMFIIQNYGSYAILFMCIMHSNHICPLLIILASSPICSK